MKRFVGLLIIGVLAFASVGRAADCTMALTRISSGMSSVVFMCSVTTTGSTGYAATATSTAITAAIKGMVLAEVRTSPGVQAPTNGTAVTIKSADSPALDLMGGVVTVSSTATTAFVPKIDSTNYGKPSVDTALTVAITGNSVANAIVYVKLILHRLIP
ncbi:MAG: hypothetical protein WC750_06275 [Patescibacteria group bacterium]